MKTPAARLAWANNLRAAATVAVIVLHVASSISTHYPEVPRSTFFYSNLFDALVRWCVPVFVMLSGVFALPNYDGNLKAFFKKTWHRIVVPFIFWSIVYLIYVDSKDYFYFGKTASELAGRLGTQLLTGTASHLWYVYLIISIYLLFPLLSKWIKYASDAEMKLFLYIWVAFLFLAPLLKDMDISFEYVYYTGYMGYLLWGYYFFKRGKKSNLLAIGFLFVAAYLVTSAFTFNMSVKEDSLNEDYEDNLAPNVVLMSFCVFLFFQNRAIFTRPSWRKIIDATCQHSYGIYLCHLLILNLFLDMGLHYDFIHPLISIPLISLVCLVITYATIYGMKKVRWLKMVAG